MRHRCRPAKSARLHRLRVARSSDSCISIAPLAGCDSVDLRQGNSRGIQEGADPEKSRRQTRPGKIIADRQLSHEGPRLRSVMMYLFIKEIIA